MTAKTYTAETVLFQDILNLYERAFQAGDAWLLHKCIIATTPHLAQSRSALDVVLEYINRNLPPVEGRHVNDDGDPSLPQ